MLNFYPFNSLILRLVLRQLKFFTILVEIQTVYPVLEQFHIKFTVLTFFPIFPTSSHPHHQWQYPHHPTVISCSSKNQSYLNAGAPAFLQFWCRAESKPAARLTWQRQIVRLISRISIHLVWRLNRAEGIDLWGWRMKHDNAPL